MRRRVEAERSRRYRHDLINAFAAVDCAATLMAQGTLTGQERAAVADLLGSGVQGLRGLVLAEPGDAPVELADVLRSAAYEQGGRDATVEVAPDLMVAGASGEVAEAIRLVLDHARQRHPAGALVVRGSRQGDRVELWVDQAGSPATGRRRVMRQGRRWRGRRRPTAGLIDVAVRLIRGQGGDVTVHARPDGGESFAVSWPSSAV